MWPTVAKIMDKSQAVGSHPIFLYIVNRPIWVAILYINLWWAFPVISDIFDLSLHNVSEVGHAFIFRWLIVIILIYFLLFLLL
jgi:hypothetical protein